MDFYLISAEMMFRTRSQEVFHMQLAGSGMRPQSSATTSPMSNEATSSLNDHLRWWRGLRRDDAFSAETHFPEGLLVGVRAGSDVIFGLHSWL